MKDFVVPFSGLKTGEHEYNFQIDDSFFEAFDQAFIENASLKVELVLQKTENMLILNFVAEGVATFPCDRCGDPFDLDIDCEERLIVKFGEESFDQTDEIIVLRPEAYEIDVSQPIYEMIILNLPSKKTHATLAECNQDQR